MSESSATTNRRKMNADLRRTIRRKRQPEQRNKQEGSVGQYAIIRGELNQELKLGFSGS